jgi:phosphoribosylpyrophosphate synthetase
MTVLRIVSGSANPGLASAIANYLGVESDGCSLQRFPDGELRPTTENVCGSDVYVIKPTSPPVNEHIVELLLLPHWKLLILRTRGAAQDIIVAATHGLLVHAGR